ncbi:hypothetical protein BJ508DRAFT_320419, partial [Ascobolus immersus RN42]
MHARALFTSSFLALVVSAVAAPTSPLNNNGTAPTSGLASGSSAQTQTGNGSTSGSTGLAGNGESGAPKFEVLPVPVNASLPVAASESASGQVVNGVTFDKSGAGKVAASGASQVAFDSVGTGVAPTPAVVSQIVDGQPQFDSSVQTASGTASGVVGSGVTFDKPTMAGNSTTPQVKFDSAAAAAGAGDASAPAVVSPIANGQTQSGKPAQAATAFGVTGSGMTIDKSTSTLPGNGTTSQVKFDSAAAGTGVAPAPVAVSPTAGTQTQLDKPVQAGNGAASGPLGSGLTFDKPALARNGTSQVSFDSVATTPAPAPAPSVAFDAVSEIADGQLQFDKAVQSGNGGSSGAVSNGVKFDELSSGKPIMPSNGVTFGSAAAAPAAAPLVASKATTVESTAVVPAPALAPSKAAAFAPVAVFPAAAPL